MREGIEEGNPISGFCFSSSVEHVFWAKTLGGSVSTYSNGARNSQRLFSDVTATAGRRSRDKTFENKIYFFIAFRTTENRFPLNDLKVSLQITVTNLECGLLAQCCLLLLEFCVSVVIV